MKNRKFDIGQKQSITQKQGLKQKQKLVLNQQIKQSLKYLKSSQYEIIEMIKEEQEINPMLDFDSENYQKQTQSSYENSGEFYNSYIKTKKYDEDYYGKDIENFRDKLKHDFIYVNKSEREREIAEYIIYNISDNGLLSMDTNYIAGELNCELETVEKIILDIQNLSPPGICTRDISECLVVQIQRQLESINNANINIKVLTNAKNIIKNCFFELGNLNIRKISKTLHIKEYEIKEAVEYIKTLSPYPIIKEEDKILDESYIIPDIKIEIIENQIKIILLEHLIPNIGISNEYNYILGKTNIDKGAKEFINNNISRIKIIRNCIEQRNKTLIRVANFICEYQKTFFKKGELYLKSLKMKDVAKALEISESTVSRAVNKKYLEYEKSIIPFSYFFQQRYTDDNGLDISALSIKKMIKELILSEEKFNTISDQKICELLQNQGIRISRRTICKFRDEMKIPNASKRKKMHKFNDPHLSQSNKYLSSN